MNSLRARECWLTYGDSRARLDRLACEDVVRLADVLASIAVVRFGELTWCRWIARTQVNGSGETFEDCPKRSSASPRERRSARHA